MEVMSLAVCPLQTPLCLLAHPCTWPPVRAVAADGNTAVTGGNDKKLCVWHLPTGVCRRVLRGHEEFIRSVQFYRPSALAVTGGWQNVKVCCVGWV